MKKIEFVKMEICHTHCIFCGKDCYQKMIFLGECGHSFCVECSLRLYEESHLSPIPFGCPPCPNQCLNPTKGPQCDCIERDEVLDQWKKKDPASYDKWVAEEILYRYKDGIFRCPVCIE
jgi:hypothetical protein